MSVSNFKFIYDDNQILILPRSRERGLQRPSQRPAHLCGPRGLCCRRSSPRSGRVQVQERRPFVPNLQSGNQSVAVGSYRPTQVIGAWVDVVEDPAGIAYLELSDVVRSKQVALELARSRGEKAIYDFCKSESIYL